MRDGVCGEARKRRRSRAGTAVGMGGTCDYECVEVVGELRL
jgi:hypothetical protein